jgi:DNA-binding beta-propeller fold protein YncE
MNRMKYVLAAASFAALGAAGCSGSREQVVVWPDPPDEPRIEYVRTLKGEEDFRGAVGEVVSGLAGEKSIVHLTRPFDVTTAGKGIVYVTDASQGTLRFDLNKGEVEPIGEKSEVELDNPRGIAYAHGNVYLSVASKGQIVVLDDEGKYVRTIGEPGQYPGAIDLVCDTVRNRLIIVDNKRHNVFVHTLAGDSLFALGKRGEADGEFNFPQSAAVDRDGNIFVVDAFNFRIEVFDANGKYVRQFGSQGDAFGMFNRPKGIAIDSDDNIYVLDAVHQNYQIFNREGQLLLFVGRYGTDNRGFINPVSIAIDGEDNIYVTDHLNGRLQVFRYLKSNSNNP